MPRCSAAAIKLVWDHIKPEHREAAREALARLNATAEPAHGFSTTLPITLRAAMSLSACAVSASG